MSHQNIHRKTQQELLNANQMLQQALDTIPVRVFWKDLKGYYLGGNLRFAQDAGLESPDELIGKDDFEMVWHEQANLYRADDQLVIQTGEEKLNYEEPQTTPNNQRIWLKTSKIPFRDKDGEIIGVLGTYENVTEHKRTQRQLEAFFNQSLDGCFFMLLDEPIYWNDGIDKETLLNYVFSHQRITRVNEAFLAQYGAFQEQMIGLTPADTFSYDINYGKNLWRQMFDSGRIHVETHERKMDGSPIWIEGEYVCLYDEHGRIEGHFGIQRDITERKLIEQERNQLISDLEAQKLELEQYAYTVSHDLKSPLITIQGFVGMLEKDALAGNIDDVQQDAIFIKDAVNKMSALLEDLLHLSRVGRVVNTPEKISFANLVNEAILLIQDQLQTRQVEVIINADDVKVFVDPLRIREVLQNLIENAVKFMGEQQQPKIEIGATCNDSYMVCYVKDNGIGIKPSYHDKVFDLFERLNLDVEGTGVGLTIVKRVIESHGGQIWIDSAGENQGSTFFFTLPAPQAD